MKMKPLLISAGLIITAAFYFAVLTDHTAETQQVKSRPTKRLRTTHAAVSSDQVPAIGSRTPEAEVVSSRVDHVALWQQPGHAMQHEPDLAMSGENQDHSESISKIEHSQSAEKPFMGESSFTSISPNLPLEQRAVLMPLSHALTSEEIAKIAPEVGSKVAEQVRDEFDQEAGVNELSPDSPEYRKRWVSAQEVEADKIRARYGWGAYAAMQREAVLKALAENPHAPR